MSNENTALAFFKNSEQLDTLLSIVAINYGNQEAARVMVLQELQHLDIIGITKPEVFTCLPATIFAGVRTALQKNLSLDPDAGLTYVTTRSVKVGDQWCKVLEVKETANGKLSVARQCGTVLDAERPQIFYDQTTGKVTSIKVRLLLPSNPAPRWEEVTYAEGHFQRWRAYSHKQNARNKNDADATKMNYANALYTSFNGGVDPEFAATKALKHALGRKGTNINEMRAINVNIPVKHVVSSMAARAEAEDDFTEAEEIPTNAAPVVNTTTQQAAPVQPTQAGGFTFGGTSSATPPAQAPAPPTNIDDMPL